MNNVATPDAIKNDCTGGAHIWIMNAKWVEKASCFMPIPLSAQKNLKKKY